MVTVTNIFNTKRSATYVASTRQEARPTRYDSFALVGVMNYDKGPLAFFEGERILEVGGRDVPVLGTADDLRPACP